MSVLRSASNRLARTYTRRDLVADLFSHGGHYDAAHLVLHLSRDAVITMISDILHSERLESELRERFTSCLIAERYLRRVEARSSHKARAA